MVDKPGHHRAIFLFLGSDDLFPDQFDDGLRVLADYLLLSAELFDCSLVPFVVYLQLLDLKLQAANFLLTTGQLLLQQLVVFLFLI